MENKIIIAQIAPGVRVALGEEFGLAPGEITTKKIVAALKKIGFDKVFDTQFTADLTIMEEVSELVYRIKNKGVLPMVTSCCPAWIKYIEKFYPDLVDNISSCKSPQQMMGAVIKSYYAEKTKIDPKNIEVISIMPCLVKKSESAREEMKSAWQYWKKFHHLYENEPFNDVDVVLSTRELAQLIKEDKINFNNLADTDFDDPLGESTGAATIFAVTGGVMEAALRTAYELVTKKPLEKIEFEDIRGLKGSKKATVNLDGLELRVAVANGMLQAKILLDEIKQGKSIYHFIEVMNCQGGCLGGSGQPRHIDVPTRMKRMEGIYKNDKDLAVRKSHENPSIKKLYQEFLGEPLSEKAHLLLHTIYQGQKHE